MNKTFLKVTKILTILSTCLMPLTIFFLSLATIGISYAESYTYEVEIGFIFLVISLIVMIGFFIANLFAISAISKAEKDLITKSQFMPWVVYTFIGSGILVGIFAVLAVTEEDSTSSNNNAITPIEIKLTELKSLYDKGIISEEEYNQRRKIIVEKM